MTPDEESWSEGGKPTTDQGATLVEYALMVMLVALVAVGGVGLVGGSVSALFASVPAF